MLPQSRALTVLLTRPEAQSERFAVALQARFAGVRVITSPLIALEYLRPVVPVRDWAGVIFTSETAVMAARRIAADGTALPRLAFCVGNQTARVARAEGYEAVSAQGDGQALVQLVQVLGVAGPLLYLHGAEVRVNVAAALNSAGMETVSVVCYAQQPYPMTQEAVAVLRQCDVVAAPVFSARTGQVLAAEYRRIAGVAPLLVAAISGDVAAEVPAMERQVALRPDAAAMLDVLGVWLA